VRQASLFVSLDMRDIFDMFFKNHSILPGAHVRFRGRLGALDVCCLHAVCI
jgi:hypothetical protein